MAALARARIPCRLNGDSFHAPVLEVPGDDFERAWAVVVPVDDLADDDSMFENPEWARAWWLKPPRRRDVGALAVGIGLLANKVRRAIADNVGCVPEGVSKIDCPYSTGAIERCPAGLWSVCRPMSRLEVHLLAMGPVLLADDDASLTRCHELFEALAVRAGEGGLSRSDHMIAFCHVLSMRMTEGRLGRIVKLAKHSSAKVVADVMRETLEVKGTVIPKRMEITAEDVAAQEQEQEQWERN